MLTHCYLIFCNFPYETPLGQIKENKIKLLKHFYTRFLKRIIKQIQRNFKLIFTMQMNQIEMHEFWISRDNIPNDNQIKRSKFLLDIFKKHVDINFSILDVGCSYGRNINYLYKAGYKNIMGIEISKKAIDNFQIFYPEIADKVTISQGSAEKLLAEYSNGKYDVIFTMALLSHIHKSEKKIFIDLERVTNKILICVDDEMSISKYHNPRNYKKIFSNLGFNQIDMIRMNIEEYGMSDNYICRVFYK